MDAYLSVTHFVTRTNQGPFSICGFNRPDRPTMSKLNAQAFEFVPGKPFKYTPSVQQAAPPPEPQPATESQIQSESAQEEAKPAATISVSIGSLNANSGSKETNAGGQSAVTDSTLTSISTATSTPPAPAQATATPPSKTTTAPKPTPQSYNFSSEKAKTDTDAIALDVQKLVDAETLGDLFGKQHLNIVFIGHVDAGKSTMGGNLLYITGMVDKRTMEKYEREAKEIGRDSWYLSWALDSTPQERSKA